MNAFDFTAHTLDGGPGPLADYRGDVLLIVNVASKCGFTPQYAGLEALHRKYKARGLTVLSFPCNQFGAQEPGGPKEIASFCTLTYDVSFPVMSKIEVNGPGAHPISGIKWNFTKFLVGRDGEVKGRFAPTTEPKALEGAIEALL
jgi:glutathione peroxidase